MKDALQVRERSLRRGGNLVWRVYFKVLAFTLVQKSKD